MRDLTQPSTHGHRALLWWIDWVTARPGHVALMITLLTVLSLGYTIPNLTIDTSTTDMTSVDVPFRQNQIVFRRAFSQFAEPIVAVIQTDIPERAEQAAQALAESLRADPRHFAAVDYPEGQPFLLRHSLLYLPVDQLAELVDRLNAAQPLLATLAGDPPLRGIAQFVSLALDEAPENGALPQEFDQLLGAFAAVAKAQREGRPSDLSWRNLMLPPEVDGLARRIVIAQPKLDYHSIAFAAEAIDAIRDRARALGIVPERGLTLSLTGPAALDQEELESVSSGTLLASVLTTAAVTGLLVWGLGSWRLIAATLVTLPLGLIATAALATFLVGRLNLISVTFAVLFVGFGVDFGIHLALRYREALKHPQSRHAALQVAVVAVGNPFSLSASCAIVGFLAFIPTDYLGLAELGIISAGGMAVAWFMSLTLLPALLCLMPLRPQGTAASRRPRLLPGIERHSRVVLAVAGLLGLASLALVPRLEFDFNPLNLKDPASESMRTLRALAADGTLTPYTIDIVAPDLDRANLIATQVEALEGVGQALTLQSFIPPAQDDKLELIDALALFLGPALDAKPAQPLASQQCHHALVGLKAALGRALEGSLQPDLNPGAAQLDAEVERLLDATESPDQANCELERRLTRYLPDLLGTLRRSLEIEPVTFDDLPEELRSRWRSAAGEARVLVLPQDPINDNQDLQAFASSVLAAVPHATGVPIVVTEAGETVVEAFLEASFWALCLVTLFLALVLRSVTGVLMVLAPVALAVVFTAANAVLFGLELNFVNVIVLPLLLGLGVSGAIHVVMRWREESGRTDVIITSTPRAVMFSELTTIASFGSLAVSSHPGLASMGALLTIALTWSLICTLVVLPCMLMLFGRTRARNQADWLGA